MAQAPAFTLYNIKASKFTRHGSVLMSTIKGEAFFHDDNEMGTYSMEFMIPCWIVQTFKPPEVRDYAKKILMERIENYGPFSFQRLCTAVIDAVAKQDLTELAKDGLIHMTPQGRA